MAESQSWDAFWAEVQPTAITEVICGIEVAVPQDVTLAFKERLRRAIALGDDGSEEDVAELLAELFGADVYRQWVANGMTEKQLLVAFAWACAALEGRRLSFAEAFEAMQPGPPVAANREQRRAARRSQSAAGGGQSRPTSPASTGSGRSKSRR